MWMNYVIVCEAGGRTTITIRGLPAKLGRNIKRASLYKTKARAENIEK